MDITHCARSDRAGPVNGLLDQVVRAAGSQRQQSWEEECGGEYGGGGQELGAGSRVYQLGGNFGSCTPHAPQFQLQCERWGGGEYYS